MKTITVITPSYNRAHTLPLCYKSLKRQSSYDFSWMIVDDGSSDTTSELVEKWIKESNDFNIIYFKKANGGKASALNYAFQHLETPFATVLDSDDTFIEDAIEKALVEIENIKNNPNCCGLMAFRHNPDGKVMGGREIPHEKRYSMIDQLRGHFHTELICFYKSDLLKKTPFPQFEGEKYVSPQWLDFELSRNYYYLSSSSKFCFCTYISDGLTMNKKKVIKKNPRGYTAVKRQSFEFSNEAKYILKHGIMYVCGCMISGDNWVKNSPHKFVSLIVSPISYLLYIFRFKRL